MHAEILTIGDELCRGEIVDTNSSGLAQRLWDLDITTRWMTSCCDDENDITTALLAAVNRADLVVCSGGLGPTEDDLTVDVISRLAGQDVIIDETARARMEARFAGRIEVTPIQLRQVRVPAQSRVYVNPAGLAPCFEVDVKGVPVICLPGIPRELYAIYEAHLEARFRELREARGVTERIARRIYRVFGKGESQISQACRGLVDNVAGASIHYQVKFPETLVKLVVRDVDAAAAQQRLDALDAGVRERLAGFVYGTGEENLVDKVSKRLLASGVTVATAESCTGGMIGELLTAMPGMSKVFKGGAIVYSNAEKTRQLGVRTDTLAEHGAVSEQTAVEMAEGALERFGVDLAISVTGIAGPDGGTPDKPVGTVWLAAHSASGAVDPGTPSESGSLHVGGGTVHLDTITKKLGWPGLRDQIRTLSAWWAFKLIDEMLERRGA
ncbi:MAG TPA: CinA family nicotinamide mononucleotide deamidase-related protein [Kofleriaceae bacterium]|nr:CinA family nicotinamide mononucleotide deamidase-related protein [Kofleriaceae bacterium]